MLACVSMIHETLSCDYKAPCDREHTLIMKDYTQILQNLKLYLEYLKQDDTCNPKVVSYVEREIQRIEQRGC